MSCIVCGVPVPGTEGELCEACAARLPVLCDAVREWRDLPRRHPIREDALRFGPRALCAAGLWDELAALLTDLPFLEVKAAEGMVFELAEDLARVLPRFPPGHPRRLLSLLEESLRRDLHFIARQPESLFQCLWNSCWWYDCPQAADHYDPPEGGWPAEGPPWEREGPRLSDLVESWRRSKEGHRTDFLWLRSLRPPSVPLRGPEKSRFLIDTTNWRLRCLRFSRVGERLFAWLNPAGASDTAGRAVVAWDTETGREVEDVRAEEAAPHDPAISPGYGPWRVPRDRWRLEFGGPGGGWGQPVRLLDHSYGEERARFATDDSVNIQSVAWAANERSIAGGGWDEEGGGEVAVWATATESLVRSFRPAAAVLVVALDDEGQRVAGGTSRGDIQVWSVDTGALLVTLRGHEDAVNAVTFSPDGRWLASGSWDGTVRVWDLQKEAALPRLKEHPDDIAEVVFTSDGKRVVTRSSNSTTWLWDATDGSPVSCLHSEEGIVLEGGHTANSLFAGAGEIVSLAHGTVWDAERGETIRSWDDRRGGFYWDTAVVWSPDGHGFAAFDRHRGSVSLFKLSHLDSPLQLEGHEDAVNAAAFAPDGRFLASASKDGTIRVWDVPGGAQVACLRGHEGEVTSVAFSPDGGRVVSGATDRTVRVWDASSGDQRSCFRIEDPGRWRSGWSRDSGKWEIHAVCGVAFSRDGRHVLTWSDHDRLRVWDPVDGRCLETHEGRTDFRAFAAGAAWRAFVRGSEVQIEAAAGGGPVAWLPCPLNLRTPTPTPSRAGGTWAAAARGGLWLFRLEGSLWQKSDP